ncbi:MAG: TIGR01777 family oxidoreductase [Saprospiraceae bacterium]
MKKLVLIAGGSGLIGGYVSDELAEMGYEVNWLSRKANESDKFPSYVWDPVTNFIDPAVPQDLYAIINLAGTAIAGTRWTTKRKASIIDSRIESNQYLQFLLQSGRLKANKYVSAAAMGYYGNRGEAWIEEDQKPHGKGFLQECCVQWEESIENVSSTGINTVWFRIGLVLAREGGALPQLKLPFKFGLGLYFAAKNSFQSWIHIQDLARMFAQAIQQDLQSGAYNAAAPNPVKNIIFANEMKAMFKHPTLLLRIPPFMTRLLLGEMSQILLTGVRMNTEKIRNTGFEFKYPTIEAALQDLK